MFTLGKVVAGTEALNKAASTAITCEPTDLDKPRNSKSKSIIASGRDTLGETAAIDSVKTLYPSTVGIIGLGKLARANLTSTSTSHKVIFDEAKSPSTDLKTAEPLKHKGTLYPSTFAALDVKKVVGVSVRVANETS